MNCAYATGFPAMTSFLGFGYCLTYKIPDFKFYGMGVIVHEAEFQSVQKAGKYTHTLKLKKAPLNEKGKSASIIMKGYVHLDVSLVIECNYIPSTKQKHLRNEILPKLLTSMRLAGGDIHPIPRDEDGNYLKNRLPSFFLASSEDDSTLKHLLMPGYAIISRIDLMDDIQKEGRGDALDRLLYALSSDAIPVRIEENTDGEKKAVYEYKRHFNGWFVPLAVGFHDLSGNLPVSYQRGSGKYEHHFVEPLMTLCEFKMPHRFDSIGDILWHYEYDEVHHNYLCINSKRKEA